MQYGFFFFSLFPGALHKIEFLVIPVFVKHTFDSSTNSEAVDEVAHFINPN